LNAYRMVFSSPVIAAWMVAESPHFAKAALLLRRRPFLSKMPETYRFLAIPITRNFE